jgi:exopolysaccharide production protein ExoY
MFFAGQPDAFHLQPPAASGRPVGGGLKRALDIAVASSAIILLFPLFAIVALLVLITMGRPVFSRRTHVGFGGRAIDCYRFRSMAASDAVASQASLATLASMSGIDRLPELFNVLMGDLSWVGPQPLTAERLHPRKGDGRLHLRARPGVTGIWAPDAAAISLDEAAALDSAYARNWSMRGDIRILWDTLPVLLRRRADAPRAPQTS